MDPNRPVSVSIPPSKISPTTVSSIFPPRAGGYQVHDLQQLKPETFSCFLSDLDHVPQLYPVFPTPPAPTSSRPRLNGVEPFPGPLPALNKRQTPPIPKPITPTPEFVPVNPNLKVHSKPRSVPKNVKPKQPREYSRARNPRPESTPLFTPLPLGASHVDPKNRPLGNRMTKQMFLNEKSLTKSLPLQHSVKTLAQIIKDRYFLNTSAINPTPKPLRQSASSVKMNTNSLFQTTPPSSSVESEEYEVEYLYLTKIIIRKKKPTSTQPNPKEICRKRKFHEDNAEMQRLGKKARVDL